MLVPDEALGTLKLEAFLRVGGRGRQWGRWGQAPCGCGGTGRKTGLETRLAVGRDPLDAAIGGDALLKAALHELGVIALLLHLRT